MAGLSSFQAKVLGLLRGLLFLVMIIGITLVNPSMPLVAEVTMLIVGIGTVIGSHLPGGEESPRMQRIPRRPTDHILP